ncbi:helix-turn-helix domain-containing protein [Pseudomonas sp. B21-023]|uniref:helix-turn-helix domain-containing protein n=1 Tax=Pseudomonas sp. B21-023 TaxID=2895477 RepID=UPI002852E84E|nr:helix-turn-helix domain-containing protein [Pseudomonas sp. B21-023]
MSIQEMLRALIAQGFSQRAIADRVGVTQPTIYRATKGAAVRYEVGKAIEVFYDEQVQREETDQK